MGSGVPFETLRIEYVEAGTTAFRLLSVMAVALTVQASVYVLGVIWTIKNNKK